MRYSLLSRFRGAVLGAAVARIWENSKLLPQWETLAVFAAENLIQKGQLDLEEWKNAYKQAVNSTSIKEKEREWAGAAYAILPVILFFHEDDKKMLSMLEQTLGVWEYASCVRDWIICLAVALAQALQEKLNPASFIPEISTYFQENSQVSMQLLQVQTWLEEGLCLEAIKEWAQHSEDSAQYTSIALALYCFLSTPEDMRVSVMRAARIGKEPSITVALTGAISGAYNSIYGIPVAWRSQLRHLNTNKAVAEIIQLGERLFAAWCGAYDISAITTLSVTCPR
ncbi:MAG: ADP-ribosylglycohydrolase family protein [Oscillatoriaceae bacterium SKW80]|nr:ADP-ribosylglycohydrolase family protein [Oscillatoriaceae bacterium SKYG93]MCX8120526.1 ADP-ribosylglycohydrolase family protein [Oscillatoriaceae bacterium SKW80]MDW8452764.1 ADP-ribosylglycohydrolase family protein [Oscillatoriaceae cyanobacterium SKYGB_i_bin93]HIK27166.1 ADP-ribosylglycohydrolase family protein [Oscillatoriaceae cyanobacterium M7585_C2015_266]